MNIPITISFPKNWKDDLETLAHKESLRESRNITYGELIRKAVSQVYNLEGE